MNAECAGNRRKLIFTKYLHQVSYLFNACVHLISVYAVQCVSIIIQYNITTSSLLLSTSHNVYTCHKSKISLHYCYSVVYQVFGVLLYHSCVCVVVRNIPWSTWKRLIQKKHGSFYFLPTVNAYLLLTSLKVCDWSGHISVLLIAPLLPSRSSKKMAVTLFHCSRRSA